MSMLPELHSVPSFSLLVLSTSANEYYGSTTPVDFNVLDRVNWYMDKISTLKEYTTLRPNLLTTTHTSTMSKIAPVQFTTDNETISCERCYGGLTFLFTYETTWKSATKPVQKTTHCS